MLHVAQPEHAGVPACVVQLLEDQVARDLQVTVACPPSSAIVPRARDLGVAHVAWRATRSPGPSVISEMRSLARIVARVAPDIVHLHSSKAGLAGRLAVRGRRPTLYQPNGWSFEAVTGLERQAAIWWERFGARWASLVVCVSEQERERGVTMGIRASWRVVPNGVDLHAFPCSGDSERRAARDGLGLDGRPLAICVGRLARQKGQDVLLDAWPFVLARVPTARLAIVGDGPDRRALEQRDVPSVVFAGHRHDVRAWLAAADVVALPSRWEGMALTMLEAMASGRSVVATDVSGAREALAGEAGTVVPPENPGALAIALAERLANTTLAGEEGASGRSRAERFHDVRLTTAAVAELYSELT